MVYLRIAHLKEGMILSNPVYSGQSSLPLLVDGHVITNSTIQKLVEKKIEGVYVNSDFLKDVIVESSIPEKAKKEMAVEIKSVYQNILKKGAVDKESEKRICNLADFMIDQILAQEECTLNVIEIKSFDNYTYSHSVNVGILAVLIGTQLGYSKTILSELAIAGMLHDLGKLDISIDIINKPSALTDEEFAIMKKHPDFAVARLAGSSKISSSVLIGIESHHEKYDGSGYPNHFTGTDIPIFGRILAIADVYDAVTSARSYRPAWYPDKAIEFMMGGVATHFDYDLIQHFLKIVVAYPIGTIVELSNGSIGVVTKNSQDYMLRPDIRIISPRVQRGQELNLASDSNCFNITIVGTLSDMAELPSDLFD